MTDHDQTCGEQYSVSFTFDGTMANSGCNSASGTLTNTEGPPYSNPDLTMTKPPDDPDGSPTETTAAIAWWGAAPTVLQFQGTIQASTSFAGRQVFEAPNFEPTDTCWFSGLLESQRFHITGGGWFVGYYYFDNRWHYDYVGMGPGLIDIYRNNNRIPCSAAAGQNMHLYTYGTSFSLFYKNNVLQVSLPDDFRIRVARDGPVDPCVLPTCAERAWGIQTEYLPFAVQGIPYTISGQPVQLTAALQTTPYNWVKIEGSLPAGLTLLSSGVISGTPLAGGLSAFRVQVTDSNGFWATRFFILIVLPAKVPGQLVSD
ncbi:MAG: putative Ig domain-containing protein [Acidobacteria bacterium]|nr:putative Ig domain-containing protein [Acidobacteriota bacterium]